MYYSLLTPGQVEYTVFSVPETPDSLPTVTAVYQSGDGSFSVVSGTTPTVAQTDGLRYRIGWTVPADSETGDKFDLAVDVVVGGETRNYWVPGGRVDLRDHGLTPTQAAELTTTKDNTEEILQLQNPDVSIDTSGSPWVLVISNPVTSTVVSRKELYQPDGSPVTSTEHIIGRQIEE